MSIDRGIVRPGPLARIETVAAADGWTLVFERELHHPPAAGCSGLTDPEQLATPSATASPSRQTCPSGWTSWTVLVPSSEPNGCPSITSR